MPDVRINRVFDAPRELVFEAFTDPDQVARWWGPDGFDTPRQSVNVDLRVGGRFELTMVVVDQEIAAAIQVEPGTEFADRSEIVELAAPELIVLRSEPQPEYGIPDTVTTRIELHEEDEGRTRLLITSGPHTDEMAPNAETGWQQQLDKLVGLLAAAGR